MKIAIDGPAGAGKSTIAKLIAEKLGYVYVDTGAMYRAITFKALQAGVDLNDPDALYALILSTKMHFTNNSPQQRLICDGLDITEAIRSPEVTESVGKVARHKKVREEMVKKQQEMAEQIDVVMDGRDIGEYVLPAAEFKFFLTADIQERARRRAEEWHSQGYAYELSSIKKDLEERDRMDSKRAMGSLKILPDSIVFDTSMQTIDEVLSNMLRIIRGN